MPTLTQLSNELGVSVSTISRVLNNDSTLVISGDTRKKIITYAKEIGYINKISKSKPILMLYHCNPTDIDDINDPFFNEIKTATIELCKEQKITLHIYRRGEIPATTANINGIIAIGTFNIQEIDLLKKYSHNITFINSFPDLKEHDSIVVDDAQAVEDVVDFFLQKSITKIDFIGGEEFAPNETTPRLNRRKNHFEYYSCKLHIDANIYIGGYSYTSGYNLTKQLLTDHIPQAIICASDSIAQGALEYLNDNGYNVPNDIQIVGFNDDEFASTLSPSLSTMRVHKTHMAMYAIENLLNRIKSPSSIHTRTVLPATLIVRESTK